MSKKNVEFELNLAGLNELMKSSEMQQMLGKIAQQVAFNAGSGYGSDVHTASYVSIGTAFPASAEAAQDNWDNNSLLKSLQATGLSMKKG